MQELYQHLNPMPFETAVIEKLSGSCGGSTSVGESQKRICSISSFADYDARQDMV
jgi:hypothetical protein